MSPWLMSGCDSFWPRKAYCSASDYADVGIVMRAHHSDKTRHLTVDSDSARVGPCRPSLLVGLRARMNFNVARSTQLQTRYMDHLNRSSRMPLPVGRVCSTTLNLRAYSAWRSSDWKPVSVSPHFVNAQPSFISPLQHIPSNLEARAFEALDPFAAKAYVCIWSQVLYCAERCKSSSRKQSVATAPLKTSPRSCDRSNGFRIAQDRDQMRSKGRFDPSCRVPKSSGQQVAFSLRV